MPFECETLASPEDPLLGIYIDIDMSQFHELIGKKIRLTKARDLMVQENMKACIAADKVGYESASQFSREFKRYFGQSPAEMIRESRVA